MIDAHHTHPNFTFVLEGQPVQNATLAEAIVEAAIRTLLPDKK